MSPEPDPSKTAPSAAESALQDALQPQATEDIPHCAHRQERLRKAFRLQTAAHDLRQFLVHDIIVAMGKVLHVLWKLATAPGDPPQRNDHPKPHDHDQGQ